MKVKPWLLGLLGVGLLLLVACGGGGAAPAGNSAGAAPVSGAAPAASKPGAAQSAPASASAAPTAVAPLRMVVNWSAVNGAQAGLWTAQEQGLFREQGLDVEFTHVSATSRIMQAMVAGEIHLSTLDVQAAITSSLEGAEVVFPFAAANRMIFSVLSQPSLQQPAELRGKTLGITRLGAGSHAAGLLALKTWGLAPDRDVAMRQLGEASGILAGLQANQIEAGVISSPTSAVAREAGFRELINLYTDGADYVGIAVGGPPAWITANEEAMRRFARAYVLAVQRFKADPALGRAVYQKYFGIDSPAVLEATYQQFSAGYAAYPYVSEAGLANLIADMATDEPRLAGRQAAEWLDTRWLRELEAAGFPR